MAKRTASPSSSSGLSSAALDSLRPHVVDLQDGAFSTTAELKTTAADVDAIFSTHLPAFIKSRGGQPVPAMFWAHGGLVSEASALAVASLQIPWWLSNGIYPIFFIWHTDLWSTVGDLVANHVRAAGSLQPEAAPAFKFSDITDAAIEVAVRDLGGPAVWGAMKTNAERSSAAGGGAAYVATALKSYVKANPGTVSLHAAGHSAGAVFHAHFAPTVIQRGVVEFETCSLLAPAVRTDVFARTLEPFIGAGIKSTAMFTMNETAERNDSYFGVYRKSLLYLIRGALEPERNANILGLQQCIESDAVLTRLFPTAPSAGDAEAIWSPTNTGPLSSRSNAITHSGFNSDVSTMDSVARRVANTDNILSFALSGHPAVLDAATTTRRPQ
ncbi:hypothetical protein AAGW05_16250 [Arthrobacter sp. LAPM80]|uniref:hypothetical protein n=1 Tax=Arthrobacter sp. LAPM80 TaxID=3141788 RepID=UPI00398B7054